MNETFLAYAADPAIRRMASSGGFVKSFLCFLLQSGTVDALIITRSGDGQEFHPEVIVTQDPAELLTPLTNSVYYPTDPFAVIPAELDPAKRYAVVLLPCQVRQLRLLQATGVATNVTVVVELVCNYLPKPAWTLDICRKVGVDKPTSVLYRSDGWPGTMRIQGQDERGETVDVGVPHVSVWTNDAARSGMPQCQQCLRMQGGADLTVGCPWFEPFDQLGTGKTVVRVHKDELLTSLRAAELAGALVLEPRERAMYPKHVAPIAKVKHARAQGTVQRLLTWYWLGGQSTLNFGEHFTELLLQALGYKAQAFEQAKAAGTLSRSDSVTLIIGSEFHRGLVDLLLAHVDRVHVWGQGNGRQNYEPVDMTLPEMQERVKIHALRGPLTKARSKFTGDVPLLDPGFLMPRLYPLQATRDAGVLFIPHHLNTVQAPCHLAALQADDYLDVMIPQSGIRTAMRRIVQAKFALVNSMHAWIFCLAYRVPCAVALMPGETLNMPDKWLDVLQSLGGGVQDFRTVRSLADGMDWWEKIGQHLAIPDSRALLEAFPFPRKAP